MITIYPTIYRTDEPHYITLEKALSRIQNGDQKATVDLIRQGNENSRVSFRQYYSVASFANVLTQTSSSTVV